MKRLATVFAFLCVPAFSAHAGDFSAHGFVDLRLAVPTSDESWINGGFGKFRYDGADGRDVDPELGEVTAQLRARLTLAFTAVTTLRYEQEQASVIDMTEAYFRYRPVSTSAWRWSVKGGAFFPPISFENEELGWKSTWTLTPSALNSWVGEELRTIGGEVTLERRSAFGTIALTGALYGWNDPAGIMLADRGWAFNDRPTGLFDRLRLPDALAEDRGVAPPLYTLTFKEIDNRPGWYASLNWQKAGFGRVSVLRYDNEADPSALKKQLAWRTSFWSAGIDVPLRQFVLMGQVLVGSTAVAPNPLLPIVTRFHAGYVLAGWHGGAWRLALRYDIFRTHNENFSADDSEEYALAPDPSEHGTGLTFAVSWLPRDWLRMTGEVLRADSFRAQRVEAALSPRTVDTQFQLSTTLFF